jgi:hypothetical protein
MKRFRATVVCLVLATSLASAAAAARIETDLSGTGWRLWHDKDAKFESDELFLPPVALTNLPAHAPTGGWNVLNTDSMNASVPGTVEQYLQEIPGPPGDIKGVSWWCRTTRIPESPSPGRYILKFDSVRLRAEVYLNRKLVGYDVVGNTPFEVDITDEVKPGMQCELAVRVTDPGGNHDWRDSQPFMWGDHTIPMSHGFGGITGRVKLIVCDPVYIDDIYVQNTPAVTNVNVVLTVKNTTGKAVRRDLEVSAFERTAFVRYDLAVKAGQRQTRQLSPNFRTVLKDVELKPGDNVVTCSVSGGNVRPWSPDHPMLYVCQAFLKERNTPTDEARQNFGFPWFAPEGIGINAVFRLNGKRIVLRSAISWGFWPINGIFPTRAQAEREIRIAKELGQNMLNFHRCIGHPISLECADELGLLIYEEPGGYASGSRTEFSRKLAREKLLRMVKRDRSHPSLVIYNMINESWEAGRDKEILAERIHDMRDAHELDPSRTITHTSAWAREPEGPAKMHMRPFDTNVHMRGWYDFHHAGGPEVWKQDLYARPGQHYGWTTNDSEIVFWGEEGAISTPPRLAGIEAELEKATHKGWDGALYLEWFEAFDNFIARKNLRSAFPTVDALTVSMGNISLEHQARKIENHRICDATDGYVVNGWEAQIIENHSGIVDCFRNPKGDPAIMNRRNQTLFVAVKPRSQFVQIPGDVIADFYAVNEENRNGPFILRIVARDPSGRGVFTNTVAVKLSGGDVYGELLAKEVTIPIAGATGMFRVEAALISEKKVEIAQGHDEVLAVDWKSANISGKGAVWEGGRKRVSTFLNTEKKYDAADYRDDLEKLDWIVVARPPNEEAVAQIPVEFLRHPSDETQGLLATFHDSTGKQLHQRVDKGVNLQVEDGATPDPAVPLTEGYSVRWEGRLSPPIRGDYTFVMQSAGDVRVTVNGEDVILSRDRDAQVIRGRAKLEAGKAVPVKVEYSLAPRRAARCTLTWSPPEIGAPGPERLLERVREDGTTLFIIDRAETWMDLIQTNASVKYGGAFKIGLTWLGGNFFVREHPLFEGLPVNQAMNWPYQGVVRDGRNRLALKLEGEELVAGAWHSYPMQLGTAVGVIPCGKGRIVFSTLDICDSISARGTEANVARKLLCNFIAYAGRKGMN